MANRTYRYDVWNSHTDEIIIVDGTSEECAAAMGITINSFYSAQSRARKGMSTRYVIEAHKPRRKRTFENICAECGKKYKGGRGGKYCPACRSKRLSESMSRKMKVDHGKI